MLGLAQKLFGSPNERQVKALSVRVAKINALEPAMSTLSDGIVSYANHAAAALGAAAGMPLRPFLTRLSADNATIRNVTAHDG